MNKTIGIILTGCVMFGIVWIIFASMGGEPEYTNQQDIYDGSNRSVYP